MEGPREKAGKRRIRGSLRRKGCRPRRRVVRRGAKSRGSCTKTRKGRRVSRGGKHYPERGAVNRIFHCGVNGGGGEGEKGEKRSSETKETARKKKRQASEDRSRKKKTNQGRIQRETAKGPWREKSFFVGVFGRLLKVKTNQAPQQASRTLGPPHGSSGEPAGVEKWKSDAVRENVTQRT